MDDAPDFDDLLEDAMQEEFEEHDNHNGENDNDDDELEQMMWEAAQQQESQQQPQSTPTTSRNHDDDNNNYTTMTPTMMDDATSPAFPATETHSNCDDADMASDDDDDDNASPVQRPTTKKDAFSFERYTSSSVWRSEEVDSPQRATLRATEWKKKGNGHHHHLDDDGHQHGSLLSSSMPSQVHLVRHHHRRDPTRFSTGTTRQDLRVDRLLRQPRHGVTTRTITLTDGTQWHVPATRRRGTSTDTGNSAMSFLESQDDIFARVQARRRRRQHERTAEAVTTTHRQSSSSSSHSPHDNQHQLWVDKHAPTAFAHLLSDDRTNRRVIRALRTWDPYVFHTQPPPLPEFGPPKNHNSPTKKEPTEKKNPRDKRPDETRRVLLLSGSPGVGKTTLAHIAARHCGYRPLEVNGSDDRSTSVLRDRVVRAMESTTLSQFTSTTAGKPNCLILDEIDGADAHGAIQALVDIIRAELPSGGKSKRGQTYLRRPIIFICNNKYAPALRPLLPFAVHFNVEPPTPARLVTRLRSVIKAEGLTGGSSSSLLHQLVTVAGGDIRYCLFALQFAAAARGTDLSTALSQSLSGGALKDTRSDVLSVITSVFQKRKGGEVEKHTKNRSGRASTSTEKESTSDNIQSLVASYGDNSKLLDLLFLNAIRVSFIDPTFERCAAMYEWMSQADMFRSNNSVAALTNSSQHYGMQNLYIPITAGVVHCLCRVEQRQELKFSDRELSDVRYKTEANQELASQLALGISPHSRAARSTSLMGVETASYALWILSAGNGKLALDRSVSSHHLLKDEEKESFAHHVDTLRALGLTYKADPTEFFNQGSQPESIRLRLEPPIQRFVRYEEGSRPRRRPIPNTLKELLAQAVKTRQAQSEKSLDLMDAASAVPKTPVKKNFPPTIIEPIAPSSLNTKNKRKESPTSATDIPTSLKKAKATATNFLGLGAKKAKAAQTARKMARAGLDRSKTKNRLSNTGSGVRLSQAMRLKHVKGFTQAVRAPCRLDDFA